VPQAGRPGDRGAAPKEQARLAAIFGTLLDSNDDVLIDRACDIYRPLFDEVGILESRVFAGVPEALSTFRAAGHSLMEMYRDANYVIYRLAP